MAFSYRFKNLITLIALLFSYIPTPTLHAVSYGSDTAVSIVNPFNITGPDNIIKTFGAAKNGFAFVEGTVTCSFQSLFPVAGPIYLRGGKLYLQSDLILTNTGTFADLGTIIGQDHSVELSESNDTFANNTNPTSARVFLLIARNTALRPIFSLDWSYDNQYLAVVTTSGAGNELHIYSFNGTTLTLLTGINLGSNGTSVHWRPNSYYLAVATPSTANEIRVYLFTPGPNTLTLKDTQNPAGTLNSVAWQGRGNYLAVAGSVIYVYHFDTGTETLDVQYTPTNNAALNGTISFDNLHWAPPGNKNDFIAGTSGGSLHLYNFTGSAINHLKRYDLGTAIRSLDWAPTSTYVALGFTGGNIRTYQHSASLNNITFKNTAIIASTVNSVSWNPSATELTAGCNAFAGNEHQFFSFNTTSYALTNVYNIEVGNNVNAVRFSNTNGTFVARADNTTQFLSIYKESSSPFIFQDLHLFLNGNLALGSPITFIGNCSINGRGNQMTFTGDGTINIAQNSLLDVTESNLKFERPNAFSLQGKTSHLSLQNSQIALGDDIVFGDGSWEIYDDVTITGPHTFAYSTANTSTIHSHSTLTIKDGASFQIGKIQNNRSEPLEFEDIYSHLAIDNATLHITNSGLAVKKGTIDAYNNSAFVIDYTDTTLSKTTQALVFGDGLTRANDAMLILHGNGTELTVSNGAIIFDPYITQTMIQFYGQPQLSLESTSSTYIKRPIRLINGWIKPTRNISFYIEPTAYLTTDNTRIDNQEVFSDYIFSGTMLHPNHLLLDRNDNIIINGGTVYEDLTIARDGTFITGNGNIIGHIDFLSNQSSLTWDIIAKVDAHNINLGGQKIIFSQDSGITHGLSFVGTGTINLLSQTFQMNPQETTWNGDLYWEGSGSVMQLRNNINLNGTWTFSGIHTIDGNGYELNLETTGTILIERGSQVAFQNIHLENLSRHNGIVCNDNTGSVIFHNMQIDLADDYRFDKGSIFILNDVDLYPAGEAADRTVTFSYESTQTSTIYEISNLRINDGVRFSVGRRNASITNASQQPFALLQKNSKIDLAGGTLHITSSGMILSTGKIVATDNSNIEVESTQFNYGLILGDGIAAGNDGVLEIEGGQQLEISSGKIFYNNYNKSGGVNFDSPSALLFIKSNRGLTANRPMTLSYGSLRFPGSADNVGEINGGTLAQDAIVHYHDSVNAQHKVKVASSVYPLYFDDGGYVQSYEGYTSLPLIFRSGTGTLNGTAGIASPTTLTNHTVSLNFGVGRGMNNNIFLNGGSINLIGNNTFIGDNNFTGSGTINFDVYTLSMGTKDLAITNTLLMTAAKGALEFNSHVDLRGTWTFQGDLELYGCGNILDLSHGGKITVQPNTNLRLTNIVLKGVGTTANNIELTDKTSQLILSHAYIELDNNYTFTAGGIIVNGPATVGMKNYNWLFDQNASLTVDGVTLWQDPLDTINHGKITFGSGPLSKYLSLVSNGTIKTATNLDLVTQSTGDIETQVRANSNTLLYLDRIDSNAKLFLTKNNSNTLLYLNRINSNAIIKLASEGSDLVRTTSNALLYCCRTTSNALLFGDRVNSNAIVSITVTTSNQFVINNSNAIVWLNTQLQTIDHGPQNITINTASYQLSHDVFISSDHRMYIQNSTVINGNGHSIYCACLANGIIDIAAGSTVVFQHVAFRNYTDTVFNLGAGASVIFGDGVHLELLQAQTLERQWTFTGYSEICGNGNELAVDPYAIVVAPHSRLNIHGVALTGLKNTNLSCAGSTASLTLSEVGIYLDSNFNFTSGSIIFDPDVVIVGTNTFVYASDMTSSIARDSQLYLSGITFSYAPPSNNRDLFAMVDATSRFFIDGCTLASTTTGMRLTRGTLIADHKNFLDNTGGDSLSEGFAFGDGNPAHDLSIEVKPGGSLNLVAGYWDYVNV